MSVDKQIVAASTSTSKRKSTKQVPSNKTFSTSSADASDNAVEMREKRWYTWLLSPLWLCLLVAVFIRIWLTIRTHGILDGDEALLGIQAQHILQGERPIYFYGIPYFGSLEAYVVAFLFAIFGPSAAALRAETTVFSLVLVSLTWWLASLLAKAARLPLYARRCFIIVAALLAALPPLYDGIIEMRTGGGWIESFVIMLLLLIAIHRLMTRWHEGASNSELAWRWAGVGFIVGFGMWIYPLVSVAILASTLWIILDRLAEIGKRVKGGESFIAASTQSLRKLLLVIAAIPTCVIGFTPGIIWGIQNNWENIHFIFGLGGGWNLARLKTIAKVSKLYAQCVAPRVIGGGTPLEGRLLTIIHAPLLITSLACILVSVGMVLASFIWRYPIMLRARTLVVLPALFGACSAVLYCTSSASSSILISCNDDFGGRYASPLMLAMPFFFATAFTLVSMLLYKPGSWTAQSAGPAQADASVHTRLSVGVGTLVALFLLLLAYLTGHAATYGITNPDLAFQSAYCTIAPANYEPIIAYMEKEHIRYAWAPNLLAYPISFKTNNRIITADPLATLDPPMAINRIPAYTDAVTRADRASFLVFVKHGDTHPTLLQLLDSDHVTYKATSFPSQPGVDVLVVTPLSQTVSPFVSPGLANFYCAIR